MKLWLVTVGHKMPDWITTGFNEYAKRMPREARIELLEISATDIRSRCAAKKNIHSLLPDAVADYIHFHKLYTQYANH